MKTKIILLCLVLYASLLTSCTPDAIIMDSKAPKASPIYGTGGEHSAEPDNDKD